MKKLRILVVEDEHITAEDLRHSLTFIGYEVTGIATTGEDAVSLDESTSPDIILMDIRLKGGMSGLDAAVAILKKHDVPIIFITAYSDSSTLDQVTSIASYGYILKPFQTAELKANIEIAFFKHSLEAKARESEKKYRYLFDNSVVGIFQASWEGKFITVNNTLARMLCYDTPDEMISSIDNIANRMAVNNEKHGNLMQEILKKGYVEGFELETYGRDRSKIWLSITARSVIANTGMVQYFEGIIHDITKRKKAEMALMQSELIKEAILESAPDAIVSFNENGKIIESNHTTNLMFGYAQSMAGMAIFDLVAFPGLASGSEKAQYRLDNINFNRRIETIGKRSDGSDFPVEMTVTGVEGDEATFFTGFIRDISDRLNAEKEMRRLTYVMDQTPDWVIITDPDGTIVYANNSVAFISGYPIDEIIGKNPRIWKSGKHDAVFYYRMWERLVSGEHFQAVIINRRKSGELFYLDQKVSPIRDITGKIIQIVQTGRDVTDRRILEEQLDYLAFNDVLTNLPNRTLFLDRLKQTIARAEFNKRFVAVLVIDIDRFTYLNDIYGSDVGDDILKTAAKIIKNIIRDGDTIARLGNDEFGCILSDVAITEDIIVLVEKIRNVISQPLSIRGRLIVLTTSIGISFFPTDGKDPGTILQNADIASARAKALGHDTYQFFTSDMNNRASDFLIMENKLRDAIVGDEFIPYYQPYYTSADRKLTGMESLVRWSSPESGIVSPAAFIPVLEETGLIVPVGDIMVKKVCRQIRKWKDGGQKIVPVAVNLSPVQFRQIDLVEKLIKIVEEYCIDPAFLSFEITESTFMKDIDFTKKVLSSLRGLGSTVSIDDFGTGYSSLAYLKKFPLNNLKIDISFVREIVQDPDSRAIVKAIISMAHSLNLKTIAEGIETEEQLDILCDIGCDCIQGYFFSKPLPAAEIDRMI